MHEMSIVMRFVDFATEFAEKNSAQKVYSVCLQVGELTGVVPRYLEMFYPAVVEGTILEGSELVIDFVEGSVFCTSCGTTYNPARTSMKCPDCGEDRCDVIEGNHLYVTEIAIDDSVRDAAEISKLE